MVFVLFNVFTKCVPCHFVLTMYAYLGVDAWNGREDKEDVGRKLLTYNFMSNLGPTEILFLMFHKTVFWCFRGLAKTPN